MTKTMTMTAAEAVQRVLDASGDPDTRTLRRCEIGTVAAHQGDVYLHRVADDWPRGDEKGTRQVAVGQTVGARHFVEGDGVRVYAGVRLPAYVSPAKDVPEGEYLGPVVAAPRGLTLTHPEHAHHELPAGVYQVTYQVDAVRRARVRD